GGPSPAVGDRMPPRPGMADGLGWSIVLPSEAQSAAVKESAQQGRVPLAVAVDPDLPHAVLVRPDGHVALTAAPDEAAELPDRLTAWLNR
ncbi:hypothetical protein AB0G02_37500, partial [Actinosynnema sp. NPDC023658]|uniref:aromatic-ring hydroxylase C-terminal domain-containing protein n=1 Tax=Actinosynnema sp. NPDC023658 TaxID=3155465 RepID=UPI0033C29B7E